MIASILVWIALAAWAWLLLFRGRFWMLERSPPAPDLKNWPEVVAIIPARDEAEMIGGAVHSLQAQAYGGKLHVIVVDDQSTDGTAEIATAAGAVVIRGTALPSGWVGKLWALEQGVRAAGEAHPKAELFLFTDADIQHAPGVLRYAVGTLVADQLELVSQMVRLSTVTLAERAIVPAFVYFFRLLYPFRWAKDPKNSTAAAAGGFMLMRRDALKRIGGLAAIKGALIDDCTLAAAIKKSGGATRLDLAQATASMRPYGWGGLWRMIARSAYTQLHHSPLLLLGTVIGLSLGFLIPPVMTFYPSPYRAGALFAWILMALSYVPMLRYYRLSPLWAPFLPLVALFYMGATLDSARRHWMGKGGEWKGRVQAGNVS